MRTRFIFGAIAVEGNHLRILSSGAILEMEGACSCFTAKHFCDGIHQLICFVQAHLLKTVAHLDLVEVITPQLQVCPKSKYISQCGSLNVSELIFC